MNRDGPGEVCADHTDGLCSYTHEWNPWPWAIIGLLLVAAGVAVVSEKRRSERDQAT
jgi:hypothetical protein